MDKTGRSADAQILNFENFGHFGGLRGLAMQLAQVRARGSRRTAEPERHGLYEAITVLVEGKPRRMKDVGEVVGCERFYGGARSNFQKYGVQSVDVLPF